MEIPKKGYSRLSLFARILQSEESVILKHCIDHLGDKIILLQHDGFTLKIEIDHVSLGKQIGEEVGYSITYSSEGL